MRRMFCCVTLLCASLPLPNLFGSSPKGDTLAPNSVSANLQQRDAQLPTNFSSRPIPHLQPTNQNWQPVGPLQINTSRYGSITGRVTSIAIDPSDASGNHVYIGATGGGVWKSTNAAASNAGSVSFTPLLDYPAAFSGKSFTSITIGAVSIQPGGTGVILAGTGDPNDALDSYYGAGILRSGDNGSTWSLISQSSDAFVGTGFFNYSFTGEAFAGFAWSTTSPGLVVAAVTHSLEGTVNHVGSPQLSETGLYYSTDAGQTWLMATISDGANEVVQSPTSIVNGPIGGNPVTAVAWNPLRQLFFAAVRGHGYYQSVDGVTFTRLTNQPGANLSATNCPANPNALGSASCAMERGVLAVQPITGDTFALTVDANNLDQGLWQDVCSASNNSCASPTIQFAQQVGDAALDAGGNGTIPQGTYNLTLAAVPNNADTLLFAGTQDIFRCSLGAGCTWRNTTNTATCAAAQVAPAQHAVDFLSPPAGQTLPLLFFGNDGGLWRSNDGVAQTGATCASTDATHYQNLNAGLGSLSETTGLASSGDTILAGFGTAGTTGIATAADVAYSLLLPQLAGPTAIDPANNSNWYASLGPGVAIGQCTAGVNCTAADFGTQPAIGAAQTSFDQSLLLAPFQLDPQDSSNMLVGTCRVWRGPASGGGAWSTANAISPMFDGHPQPSCNGNALVRSLTAGGANIQTQGQQNSGAQVIYAGMAGLLDGGGNVAGHVFSTQSANTANGTTAWVDLALSPVVNESSYQSVFNPQNFDVSSLYSDPHDSTGLTIYAAIQGFNVPHLYRSTDGGAHWDNITQNLPDLPVNAVLVDPNDANIVYVASDGGVFFTQNVSLCTPSNSPCWNTLGTGLPLSPAMLLSATTSGAGTLRVGTYGRGIWQMPLLSNAALATMTLSPTSLTFGNQPAQTASTAQTITVTNNGTVPLVISSLSTSGDFTETDNCVGTLAANGSCQVQVIFAPTATGTRTGVLTVFANVTGGQQTATLSGTGTPAPQLLLEPVTLNFGGQLIQTASAAQQLTISNTSGYAITLTSENVTGPFVIQTNTCGTSLPPQTGCTLAIAFTPTQSGPASGTLTVVTDQGTQNVPLSGMGETPPTDTLSPLSLGFPQTVEFTSSAPQTVTLTNSGGAALTGIQIQSNGDFAVSSGCTATLNANSSCTLTVTYTPQADGAETGAITVVDSLRTQTVTLSGSSIAPATDTLSATSLTFHATVLGYSAPTQTVTLTNSGDTQLNGLSIQLAGGDFSQTNNCGSTLAAHASCTITATYTPQNAGTSSGQIDVVDSGRTQEVQLSGFAEAPATDNLSPLSLDFGTQAIGASSAAQIITLSNHLFTTLTGIQIQSSSAEFAFTTTCGATLSPGTACTINVNFSPQTTGAKNAAITVADDSRTQTVPLTGTAILGGVALAPFTADFGIQGVHLTSTAQSIVLVNGSSDTLTVLSITVTGPFSANGTCPGSMPAGASCSIPITFDPLAVGAAHGALTIVTANAGTLQTTLSGTGIDFLFSPESSTSVTVKAGTSATYTLALNPVNGSAGVASITCSGLPPEAVCNLNPAAVPLTAPAGITLTLATGGKSSAKNHSPATIQAATFFRPGWLLILCLVSIATLHLRRRTLLRNWRSACSRVLYLCLVLFVLGNAIGCGPGGGVLGGPNAANPLPTSGLTPPGTYTLTVTATAGGLTKSILLTLIVQP